MSSESPDDRFAVPVPVTTKVVKKRKTALDPIEVDLSLPEPPSKRAKRALKKGKPLPAKPQSDDEGDQDAKKSTVSTAKERSEHGVWIGNLPYRVTNAELRRWLVDNSGGAIDDDFITRVRIPVKEKQAWPAPKTGEGLLNKGFAYVDFSSLEACVAAKALSETELGGRRLLIKDSKNFEGRPTKDDSTATTAAAEGEGADGKGKTQPSQTEGRSSTKVFVGNMGFNTTEDDVWAHFEPCGAIRWVKVATFEDTGNCKGYAWVNFEKPEAAAWAVKGFVKIKEPVETVEDFMAEGSARPVDEREHEAEAETEPGDGTAVVADKVKAKDGDRRPRVVAEPRTKTRKWWVNQLHGRQLKIELAEDDRVRYKKRFGKKAKPRQNNQQPQVGEEEAD